MVKILLTGPESSGKTFLANKLALHFKGMVVPEYAREYLSSGRDYEQLDLLEIAFGQIKIMNEAMHSGNDFVFFDTGIEVIKIWSEAKYNDVNPKILDLYSTLQYDLILLCKPNIKWEPDSQRENPLDRDVLFEKYLKELEPEIKIVKVIDSVIGQRLNQAINYVNAILA